MLRNIVLTILFVLTLTVLLQDEDFRYRQCNKKDVEFAYWTLREGLGMPMTALYYFRCHNKVESNKLQQQTDQFKSRRSSEISKR